MTIGKMQTAGGSAAATKHDMAHSYIVATVKPWNIRVFKQTISKYPGRWVLVTDHKKLDLTMVKKIRPRFIFFPHWSWMVPEPILRECECVCFHETDLPYGRGGSPIQNLIVRGHSSTVISAIRMEAGLDTGPVYMKKKIRLSGSAQEIFERNAFVVARMIRTMISKPLSPKPQRGAAVVFKRRRPEQSDMAQLKDTSPAKVYDFVRMLDAETYPHAFLETANMRLEFTNARRKKDAVLATATITLKKSSTNAYDRFQK